MRSLTLALFLLPLVGLVAGPANAAGDTHRPRCTKGALSRALEHGPRYARHGVVTHPFGCAGRFAYAAVDVTTEGNTNTITVFYRAVGGHWRVADRSRYCRSGRVPRAIYNPACNSN